MKTAQGINMTSVELSTSNEERAKLRALTENTAQGIFNYLDEVENKREIYEKRWIWELLQNAVDCASEDAKLVVKVTMSPDSLIFVHSGRRFKIEEVAHLIYHGSTKKEFDIGKFGTGFLVTHLLSKIVQVRGIREDGKEFDFALDRSGDSPAKIEELMEKTWTDYQTSLKEIGQNRPHTAEYTYKLNDVSSITAQHGVAGLREIAPYILAFDEKIGKIEISDPSGTTVFTLTDEAKEGDFLTKVIEESRNGVNPEYHELRTIRKNSVEIAIEIESESDGIKIVNQSDIPRFFLGFPLFGTQGIPYPAVINSREFEPTEKRDGIFLGKDDTVAIRKNKEILEDSNSLAIQLISSLGTSDCKNITDILKLGESPQKDWLDAAWYKDLIIRLISKIRDLPIIRTNDSKKVKFNEILVPTTPESNSKVEELWELLDHISVYKGKIPEKSYAKQWADIVSEWETTGLLFPERQITPKAMALYIERCKQLSAFHNSLKEGDDALTKLNEFYTLIQQLKQESLFDQHEILPNQNDNFVSKATLLRDAGIDNTLKDVSKRLGSDIRNNLAHVQITKEIQVLLAAKKQSEVTSDLISLVKSKKSSSSDYIQANIEFLKWLLEHDEIQQLDGIPLKSSKTGSFVILNREEVEKPLAPPSVWDESSRSFSDLFPQELIVANDYYTPIPRESWEKLEDNDFILNESLYVQSEKLDSDQLESLLVPGQVLDEKKEHEITNPISLSKIAFMETREKGIIDTVRGSKEKARKYLNYIFDFVAEADSSWKNPIDVECQCGDKHKIYPALWISVMKLKSWVPIHRGKSEKLAAMHLAPLIADDELILQKCRKELPSKLLSILGVSMGEVMMYVVSKDEPTRLKLDAAMGSLYSTYRTNPKSLTEIAQLAQQDPVLFITEVQKRLEVRDQIERNRVAGISIQNLLQRALEAKGLQVDPTGVGSDFAIENDYIEGNEEKILEVKKDGNAQLFIEVKSTVQDHVKMTVRQAEDAKASPANHILAVVKHNGIDVTEDAVKMSVKFVIDIGNRIESKVLEAEMLEQNQITVTGAGDIEIELAEGPMRFKINHAVWDTGISFDTFVNTLGA